MLKTFVPAEDEYNSFTRPAVYESVRRVLSFYGLQNTGKIFYNGENEIAKLIGSNATDSRFLDIHTDGILDNKLFVTAEFSDTEFNNGYGNQRRDPTERPIWMNEEKIPLAIYPGFVGTKVDVQITGLFNSLKTAEQFRKRINRQQANQMVDFSFDPIIHLGINNSILNLLEDIHSLYAKNDPTTESLGDWFDKYARTPITTISNVAGGHKTMVVPKKLTDVGIIFSDPILERVRKNSNYGRYEVTVKYHFYLNSFSHWELEYPLNVYQDEIPQKWIPVPQETYTKTADVKLSQEVAFGSAISNGRVLKSPYYLRLPNHDPWTIKAKEHFQPVVQARLKLQDLEEQLLLTDLFDIPGFTWATKVKAYILSNKKNAFKQHATLFPIYFFADTDKVAIESLILSDVGSVTLTTKPNLKKTYRVLVGVDFAVRDFSDEFWDHIKNNPEFIDVIKDVFDWLDWDELERNGNWWNPDGSFNVDDFRHHVTSNINIGGSGSSDSIYPGGIGNGGINGDDWYGTNGPGGPSGNENLLGPIIVPEKLDRYNSGAGIRAWSILRSNDK